MHADTKTNPWWMPSSNAADEKFAFRARQLGSRDAPECNFYKLGK